MRAQATGAGVPSDSTNDDSNATKKIKFRNYNPKDESLALRAEKSIGVEAEEANGILELFFNTFLFFFLSQEKFFFSIQYTGAESTPKQKQTSVPTGDIIKR